MNDFSFSGTTSGQSYCWAAMKPTLLCCTFALLLTGCFIFGDRFGTGRAVSLKFLPPESGEQTTLTASSPDVQKALEITDSVLTPAGLIRATPSPAPDANGSIAYYNYTPDRPRSCAVFLGTNRLNIVFRERYEQHSSEAVKEMCGDLAKKFRSYYDPKRVQVQN
jgi:hypothetical protein